MFSVEKSPNDHNHDHAESIRKLQFAGIDIRAHSQDILYWAARHGNLELAEYAVELGANVIGDENYAIQCAAECGHLDVVEYLVAQGADITANDNIAIRLATMNGHLDVIKYAVVHGANIPAHNIYAFHRAAWEGHLDVIKYLAEHGVDITANDNYAIRCAAENGQLDVIKYLVEHGADITANNNEALVQAAYYGHLDVVKYLVAHGANIAAQDNRAFQMAHKRGHTEVADYIKSVIDSKTVKVSEPKEFKSESVRSLEFIQSFVCGDAPDADFIADLISLLRDKLDIAEKIALISTICSGKFSSYDVIRILDRIASIHDANLGAYVILIEHHVADSAKVASIIELMRDLEAGA